MRRPIVIIVTLFILLGLFSQTAHAQLGPPKIGISIGSNFSQLSDIDLDTGVSSFENSQGWHAEIWFDLPTGRFEFRPALRYTQAGSIFAFADEANSLFQDDFNVSMFEIPFDLRFNFQLRYIQPYMTVGPIMRFSSSSKGNIEGMRSASIAGGIGIGMEIDFCYVTIYPEMKYAFGLTPFLTRQFSIQSIPFETNNNTLLNGVMLRIGMGTGGARCFGR